MPQQLMFVYGSLRPGEYNSDRFSGETEVIARNVQTRGRMRCVDRFGYGGYPLVDVFPDDDLTITGDIIRLDVNSSRYRLICDMEIGAGYVPAHILIPVKVSYYNKAARANDTKFNGRPEYEGTWFMPHYSCLVWHYPAFDEKRTPIVESGDWLQWRKDHPLEQDGDGDELLDV